MQGFEEKPLAQLRDMWPIGKMARFLRITQEALLEKVRDGIVPCETNTRVTAISESGEQFTSTTYSFDVKRTLACLNYKPRTREKEKKVRPPHVFGYARASHRSNSDTDSVPAQIDRCTAFAATNSKLSGLKFGGVMQDLRTSAYKTRFFKREGGHKLARLLQRGDHLVVDKVDRIWRNVRDFTEVMEIFKREGVTVHFVDQGGQQIDTGTPWGEMFMTVLVMVAQLESNVKSQRNKESYKRLDAQELATRAPPFGMRTARYNGLKRFVWQPYERYICDLVVRWHDNHRLDFVTIAKLATDRINHDAPAQGGASSGWTIQKRKLPLSSARCLGIYVREKNIRLAGISEACKYSPRKLRDGGAWKEYREIRYIPTEEIPGNPSFAMFTLNKLPISGDPDYASELTCPSPVFEAEIAGEVG